MHLRTESHFHLGQLLLRRQPQLPLRHRCAFLLGCVEPDLNLLTYLRGTLSHGRACGHNYSRTLPVIIRLAKRLCPRGMRSSLDAFRLGVLLHYVADAFTHTHNDGFSGGIAAHNRYEKRLKSRLPCTFSDGAFPLSIPIPVSLQNFVSVFLNSHDRYLRQPPGPDSDTRFIAVMSLFAFSLFSPHSPVQTLLEEPA